MLYYRLTRNKKLGKTVVIGFIFSNCVQDFGILTFQFSYISIASFKAIYPILKYSYKEDNEIKTQHRFFLFFFYMHIKSEFIINKV